MDGDEAALLAGEGAGWDAEEDVGCSAVSMV